MNLNEQQRREVVFEFYNKHPTWSKSSIVKHFVDLNFKRRTIYSIWSKVQNKKSIIRKPDSGKFCCLQNKKQRQELRRVTKGKVAKLYRQLGRKFNYDKNTIKKYLII